MKNRTLFSWTISLLSAAALLAQAVGQSNDLPSAQLAEAHDIKVGEYVAFLKSSGAAGAFYNDDMASQIVAVSMGDHVDYKMAPGVDDNDLLLGLTPEQVEDFDTWHNLINSPLMMFRRPSVGEEKKGQDPNDPNYSNPLDTHHEHENQQQGDGSSFVQRGDLSSGHGIAEHQDDSHSYLADQRAAALAQLAQNIDYKNEVAQNLRAAEEAHRNTSILDLAERERLHKMVLTSQIRFNKFTSLVRLEQAHAAYLGVLSRSSLPLDEQHTKYNKFQEALKEACTNYLIAISSEELSAKVPSRERSSQWEKYHGEKDTASKTAALQSEQLVIKLLTGLPASDASSQISSSSSAMTELEQLQEAVRAAKEERDRVEKIYDQEQEEHAHAWYQQCPPEEYEGWKRWLAKYGLAPYQGGKYKQAYERARDRHAALAQQFYDAQQRVAFSPEREVAWLEVQADDAREAILKAELRGENPKAAHDRYTALTQQLHAARQNAEAFPISALGWYQEQVDLAIRLIGEAEQRVLSPISLSLLWNHYFAMAEQRSLAKPQTIQSVSHIPSEQETSALRSFQEQLAAAQSALAPHQATKNRLQQQFAEHDQKVRGLQQQVDNFKRGKLFYNFSAELRELRSRRDAATLARTHFVAATRAQMDSANREIAALEPRVRELTTKCEQLTRAVTLSPEQRLAEAEVEHFKSPALQQHLRNYLEVIKRMGLDNKISWARTKVISLYGLRGKIFTMQEYRAKMPSLERPIKAKIEQAEAAVDQLLKTQCLKAQQLLNLKSLLVAPEERPSVVQQLEEHAGQERVVGWGDADRIAALKIAARNEELFKEMEQAVEAQRRNDQLSADNSFFRTAQTEGVAYAGRSGGGSSSYGGDYGANQRYINGCQQLLNQQQQVYNSWNAGMQSSANWHRINYGY